MQVQNSKERKKAFWNFLVFFVVTIGLVITTVFFSVQVPFKQNQKLQGEIARIEKERAQAEQFALKMNEAIGLFEKVNQNGEQTELIDANITKNLNELNSMIGKDSTELRMLYNNVIVSLYDLQASKKKARSISADDASIAEVRNQLQDCQNKYAQLSSTYQAMLMQQQR